MQNTAVNAPITFEKIVLVISLSGRENFKIMPFYILRPMVLISSAISDMCFCFARALNFQVSYQLRSLFRFCVVEVMAIPATCLVNHLGGTI